MSMKANESFSAFLDGEATELDIQRMLKAMKKEPSVVGHWHDLAKTQAAMQGEPVLDKPLTLTVKPDQTPQSAPHKRWRHRIFQGGIAAAVATVVITSTGLRVASTSSENNAPVIAVQEQSAEQSILLTQQQYEAQQQLERFLREHAEQAAFTTGHVIAPAPLEWVESE